MRFQKIIQKLFIVLGCVGVLFPTQLLHGANTSTPGQAKKAPFVGDVKLDQNGKLCGVVINVQGTPITNALVSIRTSNKVVAKTATDQLGNFQVAGISGGTYILSVGHNSRVYRVWTKQTAPPKARHLALLVVGDNIVRGQHQLGAFLSPDTIVIAGIAAAAIAIPFTLRKSNSPSSP